jgi:hypothetical protein
MEESVTYHQARRLSGSKGRQGKDDDGRTHLVVVV